MRPTIGGVVTSVLYGWPPANPPTRIEFYTGFLKLTAEGLRAVRDEIRNLGVFTLSGEHTYPAVITPEAAPRIAQAVPAVFALVDRIVAEENLQ
jgi:hypothetical protein